MSGLGVISVRSPVHVANLIKSGKFDLIRSRMAKQPNLIYLRNLEVAGRIPENTTSLELSDWLILPAVQNRQNRCGSTQKLCSIV